MTCSEPERETEKVDQLYQAFLQAKQTAGEETGKLSRSNFNAGETIQLRLAQTTGTCELRSGGKVISKFENPPTLLAGLAPGGYDLQQGPALLAHFAINMIAPGESDLQQIAPATADLRNVAGGQVRAATVNPAIFYALLLGAITFIIGAWVCQDRSR